jgi:hypothetical protein
MARYFEFLSQFYGFHLTHPRILLHIIIAFHFGGLRYGTVYFSETSVSTYESTQRYDPEEEHRHPRRRENLKSRMFF